MKLLASCLLILLASICAIGLIFIGIVWKLSNKKVEDNVEDSTWREYVKRAQEYAKKNGTPPQS